MCSSIIEFINPCHFEYFYVLHSSIVILLTYSIPVVTVFAIRGENCVDPDQMASSKAS